MAKTESRVGIITSPKFIKGLKIVIAILSCITVLSMAIPVRSILIRNQQIDQLNKLEDSITDVSKILLKILLESYNSQDFNGLSNAVDRFLVEFDFSENVLSRLNQGAYLQRMGNTLNPRLVEITTRLRDLNDNGVLSGDMPLIERKYTVSSQGFQNMDDMKGYVILTEAMEDLQFFLMHVVGSYRYEITSAMVEIEGLNNASLWIINVNVIIILLILSLVILLISAKNLQRSKLSEESAHERSENLEELVRVRTSDLEVQNRELVETRDLLVEKEKMAALGQVVAAVAHEVSTPLGVCVTAASFLTEQLKSDSEEELDTEELREIARIIETNISRAANLIKGFKRVAVDETGDEIRDFDLVAYLRDDLIPSLSPLLRKKGHDVLIRGLELCQMRSYPGAIAQIITNLVLNASVHGYGESRKETIIINISESEKRVQISVADKGIGMDKELEARIFEPFFTTNKEQGGSGLGMMIIYNLVHGRLGGSLKWETSPGEGTEFFVDIPQELEG